MAFNVRFMAVNMPASYFNWKNIDASGEFITKRKRTYDTDYPSPATSSAHDVDVHDSNPNLDNAECHVSKRQRIVLDVSIQPPRRTWMETVIRPHTFTPPAHPRRGRFIRTKRSVGSPNRWVSPSPSVLPKVAKVDEIVAVVQYPLAQDVNRPTPSSLEPLFAIARSAISCPRAPEAPAQADPESQPDCKYGHVGRQESENIQAKIEYHQQAIMSHERLAKIQAWSEQTWLEGNVAPEFDSPDALRIGELSTLDFHDGLFAVEDSWDQSEYPSEPKEQQETEPEPEWVWRMSTNEFVPLDRGVACAICCKCGQPCPCYC